MSAPINITKDFRNDLLKRREVELVLTSEKNPGLKDALKNITGHFKVDEGVVVIKTIRSRFGRNSFSVEALIYDSLSDRSKVEVKKKEKKKEGEQAAAPASGGKK